MIDLVHHLVGPIVQSPDAVAVEAIEGEASVILELSVHPDDHRAVRGYEGRTLRAIRTIVSAAAGKRRATVDLVGEQPLGDEE